MKVVWLPDKSRQDARDEEQAREIIRGRYPQAVCDDWQPVPDAHFDIGTADARCQPAWRDKASRGAREDPVALIYDLS